VAAQKEQSTALAQTSAAEVVKAEDYSAIMERVLVVGDLAKLTAQERVSYYFAVCNSMGLNPLTRPFEYLNLNGKLTLYAVRNCTDQLRSRHGVSTEIVKRASQGRDSELYEVIARATTADGRYDESSGVVYIGGLRGEALANALMKAETKAKKRATLSLVGLSMLDETEVESIPRQRAEPVLVDHATGEIVEQHAPARSDQRTVARVCAAFAEVRNLNDATDAGGQLRRANDLRDEALASGRITPNGSGRKAVDEAMVAAEKHYDLLRERESFQQEPPAEPPAVEEDAAIAAARVVYKQMRTRIAATVEDSDPEEGLADLSALREEVLALADTPGWPADGKPLASLLKLCADAGRALEQRRAEGDAAPSDLEG
jgi:hypothetical protein